MTNITDIDNANIINHMILKNGITSGYYYQEIGNIEPITILGNLEQESGMLLKMH